MPLPRKCSWILVAGDSNWRGGLEVVIERFLADNKQAKKEQWPPKEVVSEAWARRHCLYGRNRDCPARRPRHRICDARWFDIEHLIFTTKRCWLISFRFVGFVFHPSEGAILRPFDSFLAARPPRVCAGWSASDYSKRIKSPMCREDSECCTQLAQLDNCTDSVTRSSKYEALILPEQPQRYWLAHGIWGTHQENGTDCFCPTFKKRIMPGLSALNVTLTRCKTAKCAQARRDSSDANQRKRSSRVVWVSNYPIHQQNFGSKCLKSQHECQLALAESLDVTVLDLFKAPPALQKGDFHIDWWSNADDNGSIEGRLLHRLHSTLFK
eukprot:CAMPEP_0119298426 /NCGR_PEP_ID=MMETSP1333-20130426/614_1 /TAXON_ID=418940 /ORGANISM="Scyphosphaera apsteinii, Strain RCC1455" /LENGTH=324 /DNA_ID=CAMNT_0007299529 /DNA_START=195 /DNA_END=1169 /DNA_ORIENTATION=+